MYLFLVHQVIQVKLFVLPVKTFLGAIQKFQFVTERDNSLLSLAPSVDCLDDVIRYWDNLNGSAGNHFSRPDVKILQGTLHITRRTKTNVWVGS